MQKWMTKELSGVRVALFTILFTCLNGWIIFSRTNYETVFSIGIVASAALCLIAEAYNAIKNKNKWPKMSAALAIWLALGVLCFISELTFGMPVNSIVLLLVLPLFVWFGQDKNFFESLFSGAMLSGIITVVLAVLGMIKFNFLDAIARNAVSLVFAGIFALFLCFKNRLIDRKSFQTGKAICVDAVLLIITAVAFFSGGRTGFVTIIGVYVLYLLATLVIFKGIPSGIKERPAASISSLVLLLTFLIIIGLIVHIMLSAQNTPVQPIQVGHAQDNFISKLQNAMASDNMLSFRKDIWKMTLEKPTLLGNGPDFFINSPQFDTSMNSAHNIWLAVYGHYGVPAAILFFVFSIQMIVLSIKNVFKSKGYMRLAPLLVICSFFACGLCEDMLIQVSTRTHALLFYAVSAYLILHQSKKEQDT